MTPTHTIPDHLYKLIVTGQLINFYKSREWRDLRQIALRRDNYECLIHKRKGKYHKAECVHHIKEVKPHPHMALTLSNLMCLCNACHNEVHGRVGSQHKDKPFTNEERW
ncbi:putative HNH endonuclease [Psychrobacillus phage Spoks]|nr:putative HNH endonuclease [Psychrobacillus phage Spoks]